MLLGGGRLKSRLLEVCPANSLSSDSDEFGLGVARRAHRQLLPTPNLVFVTLLLPYLRSQRPRAAVFLFFEGDFGAILTLQLLGIRFGNTNGLYRDSFSSQPRARIPR